GETNLPFLGFSCVRIPLSSPKLFTRSNGRIFFVCSVTSRWCHISGRVVSSSGLGKEPWEKREAVINH
ncbi:unnamed protein product, partial [Musa textilis]